MKNHLLFISILIGSCIFLLPTQTYAFEFDMPFFKAKPSPAPTQQPSITPSQTATPSPSSSPSITPSATVSPSITPSPSPNSNPTPSLTQPTPTTQSTNATISTPTPTPTPQQEVLSTTDSNTITPLMIRDVLYIPPAKPLPEDLQGEIYPQKITVPVGFTYSLGKNLYSDSSLSQTQTQGMIRIASICLIIGVLCIQNRIDNMIKHMSDRIRRSRQEAIYA